MSELIGRNLGPYQIKQQLGMGGMATVYKAYQASMDRSVAVKVLPRHFAQDPTFVGRFEQEAKVIAKLEHARILPVYDYGEDDGTTYIVMRFLDAGTLSERMRAGKIPLDEAARIIGQIAEGLDYAHKKGVIHRDIKPSNIMLDSNGDVYITDFGISKLIEGTAQFTGSGIVGTPDYVSPEQALGQPIDNRSDIYSLGIVLYQMATNDVPFHAETPMAVIIKHIHDPLPMPRSLNPDIPEAVENVILKALAKNPNDRYQTCGALAKALSAAVGGAKIPAPAVSTVAGLGAAPTAMPMPTRPVEGREAGTIPMAASGAGSAPTQVAEKKRPGWVIPVAVIGGLILLAVCALVVVSALRNSRLGRAGGTTGGVAATASATPGLQVAQAQQTPRFSATQGVGGAPGGAAAVPPPGTPGAPQVRPLFEDHFDGNTLLPGWQWINEPKGNWEQNQGVLRIAVMPSSIVDTQAATYRLNAPALVIKVPDALPPDTRYTIQVGLKVAPTHNFQEAGLILLSDQQKPLFTLMHAFCTTEQVCTGDAVYLDDWRQFALKVEGYHARQAGGGTLPHDAGLVLRLTVEPTRVLGEYSLNGKDWLIVGDWPLVHENRIGFVGLTTATGGQDAPPIPATFDNFSVTPIKTP